jgi:ATP-dependent Clp protease ATP-binding subunit ClpA
MAYQPEYGARPVKRTLDENIIDRLTTAMLNGDVTREQPIELYSMGPLLLLRNK